MANISPMAIDTPGLTPDQVALIKDRPDAVLVNMQKQSRVTLNNLFAGDQHAALRQALRATGEYEGPSKTLRVATRPIEGSDDVEVMAIAAVSRDPGRSDDFLETIQDFQANNRPQSQKVDLYRRVYLNEGLVNNAVNKIAAILSGGGSFKIRRAKKGKVRKAADILGEVLHQWTRKVNASPLDGVVTGSRGLKAINHQAVRQALIEGSWVGRTTWRPTDLGALGKYTLPIIVQSISTANLEPVRGLVGADTGAELYFWKPPAALLRELRRPSSKEIADFLKKFIPNDVGSALKKDGQVMLDSSLLLHVKNRGVDSQAFGESFVQPALMAIAYRRAVEQLDLVVMENLVNRLTIVMVGSSDTASPYSDSATATARTNLMQSMLGEPGPNMLIVWQGDDVKVADVGAHNQILALDDRHKIADGKVKISLGVPDALLSGTTADGKAAGWAAAIGAAAQLEELQNRFAQVWTTLGERIALDNDFTDLDLVYEFDQSLLIDRQVEMELALNAYIKGVFGIQTTLERMGLDPEAERYRRAVEKGLDPGDETVTWDLLFTPPQGLQGQGAGGVQGDGPGKDPTQGRTPDSQSGKTTPERQSKPTTKENK